MHHHPFSVVTLSHNRDDHLKNLIRGIEQSSVIPDEVIVIYMNQFDVTPLHSSLAIKNVHINAGHTLPLAAARNIGMEKASYERVIFLDVDCIPGHDMFEKFLAVDENYLAMGTPMYLKKDTDLDEFDDKYLESQSVAHESRRTLSEGLTDAYTLFWSLCFSITKTVYEKIGGFDEHFTGYGGEDTDFALSAEKAEVSFYISDATCYHQYHTVYKPPVQHVEDIVINSNYYRKKWHVWPMEGWLQKFKELGLIEWSPTGDNPIRVIRTVSADELDSIEDTIHPY